MDTGSPDLGVDFVINFGDSFGGLKSLDDLIGTTSANAVREFQRIQASVSDGLNLSEASAQFKALGNTATRELRSVAQEAARAERTGEALVRQLERQNATYGKSRDEIRAMRVEEAALAAERTRNTDLAMRLRTEQELLVAAEMKTAAAAAAEAQAMRDAAHAHELFEARVRAGVVAMKEEEAALKSAALEIRARELREAAHAHDLFESRVRAGVEAMREEDAILKAASLAAHEQQLRSAAFAHDQFEAAARRGIVALREQEAAAARDAATLADLKAMLDPAATAQNRLNQELVEARRVMTAAGLSAEDMARAEGLLIDRANVAAQTHTTMAGAARKSGFALQTIALQLPDITQGLLTGQKPMTVFIQQGFQIVQVAQMAEGGLRGFGKEVAGLALRFAPLLVGLAAAGAGFALFARWVNEGVKSDQLTRNLGDITGGADATKQELFKLKDATVEWGDVSKALFEEVGKDVASQFVSDMKGMGKDVKQVLDDLTSYGRAALAGLYAGVAGTKAYLGAISSREGLQKLLTGDPTLLDRTYGEAYRKADTYLGKLGQRVKKGAIENARERNARTIGFNNEPKPKVDRHAESLARDAEAVEAQIRNLYKLADAYGVSGAAALIAEARVKAESTAIKKQADIEVAVAREIRLAVAERVKTAAQSTAGMIDQAAMQEQVNAAVAAGNVPAALANDFLQARLADLPLLAAIEAAKQSKDAKGFAEATAQLDKQRAARDRLTDAEREAQRQAELASGRDQLDYLREELRLVGATDMERIRALATIRATQEAQAKGRTGTAGKEWIDQQVEIAVAQQKLVEANDAFNASLSRTSELFDTIDQTAQRAAQGMADAFGHVGSTIGDVLTIMTGYYADQAALQRSHDEAIRKANGNQKAIAHENQVFAIQSASTQIDAFGSMASAAKGFFKEGSKGYKAMAAAEKVYRVAQLAMSIQAMVQNAAETFGFVAGSAARATAAGAEGVAHQSKLPFPANIAAMAATAAALVASGIAVFGGGGGGAKAAPVTNTGTGTVLGDSKAQSESLKRSIDALKDVDTATSVFARQMASSLRSIDNQIGGFAAVLVRSGNIDASAGTTEGFKTNAIGSVLKAIPVFGNALASLFGTKTTVIGSGLYGGAQSVGSILSGGFDASTYSDVEKKKKLFGITTSTKTSTQFAAADAGLENQFTLILRSFATAIGHAAGPLGEATGAVEARLNGFVVNIGKIDLKGLTGTEIQEKLEAIFGAAADGMAEAAFPGIARFQKAGEGTFETLVRVASTLEAVSSSLDLVGTSARAMSIDAKLGLADQFDTIGDLTSAVDAYFGAYYSAAEQSAAKTAQLSKVFDSLGAAMPTTLAGFRALVEAQDLTTTAGQGTYAALLRLAPAFADLQQALGSTRSAADIATERQDLERKLLEVKGDTAAIRALDLAKLDASNRAIQEQIYAIQDAQDAAKAADELRQAWTSVGDSIMDEVKRIRGLTDPTGGNGFATLMGQFNAANAAARGGDMDAAKSLPGLSQALLSAAADAATSRQELARVQAQTAAALEATYGVVGALTKATATGATPAAQVAAAADAQGTSTTATPAADAASEIRALKAEIVQLRSENNSGHAATAGNTGRLVKQIDAVTDSGTALVVTQQQDAA
ncbi:hypothetical protein LPN01_09710 [Sphingomonas sp. A2-49]|uniref:hypothetical protein n=1 Tax=Sphingomonas sp. A2-49 TaxID=1391375 RepID=UPI0021D0B735|nr:hypothetical protein [Sphingomonas sp. A2-49]MCU6454355.1 hypothetical protein [Sphingomonas sp. A2-49]